MKTTNVRHLSNRVLKMNVGFLLADGPGNSQKSDFNIPDSVRVADDLILNHIYGEMRLSRMKEGILVQADLEVALESECTRCLDDFERSLHIEMEELYTYPAQIGASEFFIGADCVLDLAPLLRAEVFLAASHRALCREDCQGLCPNCGTNWNHEACQCDLDHIDPRLAKLKELLDPHD